MTNQPEIEIGHTVSTDPRNVVLMFLWRGVDLVGFSLDLIVLVIPPFVYGLRIFC